MQGKPKLLSARRQEAEGDSGSHSCLTPIQSHPILSKPPISHCSLSLSPSLRWLSASASPNPSGKVPPCSRTLLLWGFAFRSNLYLWVISHAFSSIFLEFLIFMFFGKGKGQLMFLSGGFKDSSGWKGLFGSAQLSSSNENASCGNWESFCLFFYYK